MENFLSEIIEKVLGFISEPTTWFVFSSAAIIIALENFYPYNKGQSFLREGFWNDLVMYSIVQSYILGYVIFAFIHWIDNQTSLSRLEIVTHWPIWLQLLLFLVTHDLYIYLFHRYQHMSIYFWRIHEAHHSTKQVDWLSGSRSHALEILINQTVEFAPIILLGAPPEVILYKAAIDAVWGMYIHSNIDVKPKGTLLNFLFTKVINGPHLHRWHHSSVVWHGSYNYSTKLSMWDWLFGTAYYPDEKKCDDYGIAEVDFPKDYVSQHAFAFRKFDEIDNAGRN